MPSAIGIPGLYPVSLGGGTALYTTVVTNDAELATALTTDGGDTFIVAGAYTIDTDAVGAMNTTPRHFVGAGRQGQGTGPFAGPGVIIEFVGAGGSITSLNFSAGLTESEGVEWENVSMFSSTASVSAFLVGLYSAKNLNLNGGSVTFIGLSDSLNVVNCSFVNGSAGSVGFFGCTGLVNCSVGSTTAGEGAFTGFFICEQLDNCSVYYEAGAQGASVNAFQFCIGLSNCRADFSLVTSFSGGTNLAYNACTDLNNCRAIGPSIGAIASLSGFVGCFQMANAQATSFDVNFDDCSRMANCRSLQGVFAATGTHFLNCRTMSGCEMDGTGDAAATDGFTNCNEMTTCRAIAATRHGFTNCTDVSASRAFGCGGNGFLSVAQISACFSNANTLEGFFDCTLMAGCDATANGGDGFSACAVVSSLNAVGNTGVGYASNIIMSSCAGVANIGGPTDGGNLVFDPVTTLGA